MKHGKALAHNLKCRNYNGIVKRILVADEKRSTVQAQVVKVVSHVTWPKSRFSRYPLRMFREDVSYVTQNNDNKPSLEMTLHQRVSPASPLLVLLSPNLPRTLLHLAPIRGL